MTTTAGPFRDRLTPCWHVVIADGTGTPFDEDYNVHYRTELDATADALDLLTDNDDLDLDVALVASEPCWTAACARCSQELEHFDTGGGWHHADLADAVDAAVDGDWRVIASDLLCPECITVDDDTDEWTRKPGAGQLALDGSEVSA